MFPCTFSQCVLGQWPLKKFLQGELRGTQEKSMKSGWMHSHRCLRQRCRLPMSGQTLPSAWKEAGMPSGTCSGNSLVMLIGGTTISLAVMFCPKKMAHSRMVAGGKYCHSGYDTMLVLRSTRCWFAITTGGR